MHLLDLAHGSTNSIANCLQDLCHCCLFVCVVDCCVLCVNAFSLPGFQSILKLFIRHQTTVLVISFPP